MANGAQCCAIEVCCDPAAARIKVLNAITQFTQLAPAVGRQFLAWRDANGLIFAPASFAAVQPIEPGTLAVDGLTADDRTKIYEWMAHEEVVFAPAAMRQVLVDLVRMIRAHDAR